MVLKNFARALMLAILIGAGCKKSETPVPASVPQTNSVATTASSVAPTASVPITRIHWLGKKKIAADTNSASLMSVWNLPESARLEAQTLDKLSTNLFASLSSNSTLPTPSSQLPSPSNQLSTLHSPLSANLRPLLDDLVNEESYLEIRGETNEPKQFLFAIRLDTARAALWNTNLAAIAQSSTNALRTSHFAPSAVRAGDWTILFSSEQNVPLTNALARIQQRHVPFAFGATNWLDADVAWNQIGSILHAPSSMLSASLAPRIFLSISGEGKSVITRGQINFAASLRIALQPWNIPTNLISPIFSSFTAARGTKALLESSPAWTGLNLGAAPNQCFGWALSGAEMATYFAAPSSDASNQVSVLSDLVVEKVDPWLQTNGSPLTRLAQFEKSQTFDGLVVKGLPFASPFLKAETGSTNYIFGGLFPPSVNRYPLPAALLQELSRTNLVYYDWEKSGPRIESLLHVTQFLRMAANRPQIQQESAALPWLQSLQPKLSESVSELLQVDATRFAFLRHSTIGLTAIELHLFADWLESPNFPYGLHTTSTPMPVRRLPPHKNPSAAPSAPTP